MAEERTKISTEDDLVASSAESPVRFQSMPVADDDRDYSSAPLNERDRCASSQMVDPCRRDEASPSEEVFPSVSEPQVAFIGQPIEPSGSLATHVVSKEEGQGADETVTLAHLWHETKAFLRDLAFAVLIAILVIVFVVQPVRVEGTSMLPRLHDGERIFVNKFIYRFEKIERGDIVVFWYPNDPSKSFIKRVIGLPGETISIREGIVYVDGVPLEEDYIDPAFHVRRENMSPVYVRDHYYFVMGDNRDSSNDSRQWGLVPEKYIYGKAIFRYWPLSSFGTIN